jgi:hypothetical protein
MLDLKMDVIVTDGDRPFNLLEMNAGSKTFLGTSDATVLIANAIVNSEVPKKINKAEGIRTIFKNNFDGSFGQNFILSLTGDEQIQRYNELGDRAFSEVMRYYISKCLRLDFVPTTESAMNKIRELRGIEMDLVRRLREPLLNMHKAVESQGYRVELSTKRNDRRIKVATIDSVTLQNLNRRYESPQKTYISAIITRFNALTGTGRLLMDRDSGSISFRHAVRWDYITQEQKSKFSRNLDDNNRRGGDYFSPIRMEVTEITDNTGDLVQYLIHGVD